MTVKREDLDVLDVLRCDECGYLCSEDESLPAYECGSCGAIFATDEGNRCQDCNKFATGLDEPGCPDCTAATMSPVEAVRDENDELIEVEEYILSGGANKTEVEETRERERKQRVVEHERDLLARATVVSVREVMKGDTLLIDRPNAGWTDWLVDRTEIQEEPREVHGYRGGKRDAWIDPPHVTVGCGTFMYTFGLDDKVHVIKAVK